MERLSEDQQVPSPARTTQSAQATSPMLTGIEARKACERRPTQRRLEAGSRGVPGGGQGRKRQVWAGQLSGMQGWCRRKHAEAGVASPPLCAMLCAGAGAATPSPLRANAPSTHRAW